MSLAQTGGPVTVPVTTTQLSENDTKVVVQITVGGGAPVPVLLDTGSSGLIVDSSAVGSQVTTSGSTFASDFVSGAVTANLATAVVGIGGVDTPQPIQIGLVDPSDASKNLPAGVDGIMGISAADDGSLADQTVYAPNLQLPAPYDAGFALQIGSGSGASGTWTLGPVTAPTGAVSAPLTATTSAGSSPPGYPQFGKDITLCWTVGSASQTCGTTDLDIGNPSPALNATSFSSDAAGGSTVPAGEQVSVASPSGAPVWSFTSGATGSPTVVNLAQLGSATQFNTGLPLFYGRTVAWDFTSGQVLIGPAAS